MRIFLIGFMGSGKSYWGRLWATHHNYAFFDLDEAIEKEEQRSIEYVFEKKGEDHFREKEAEILRTTAGLENCIVACGGGAACFHDNIQWMNEHGTTLYLSASSAYILQKVMDEKDKRPLIKKMNEAELLFFIEKTLKERLPFYQQATYTLPAEELTVKAADEIFSSFV